MTSLKKLGKGRIAIGLFALTVLIIGAVMLQNGHSFSAMAQNVASGSHDHGADGTGHDEVLMPGLRGENATPEESAEIAVLFRNFEAITREVTDLPNGIRTVTRSTDEEVMAQLVSHVVGMNTRVEERDDPKIIIQSKTLDVIFEKNEEIKTEIEVTDDGIVVIQTSDNPEVVAALQTHALEVSDMVDRGMEAVHEKMKK